MPELTTDALALEHGEVERVDGGGPVVVSLPDGTLAEALLLETAEGSPLRFAPGDRVVLARMSCSPDLVILGRIASGEGGADRGPAARPAEAGSPVPEELVIEAGRRLTLRVGDGSITIGEDGKILIKGRDLVSHATRRNRIRGGSVSIN